MSLADARLYLVAPAMLRAAALVELVPELVAAGVDLIQLREKTMEAGDLLRVGEPLVAACREAGVPLIINDRPDVAAALDADGVHLGTNDLPAAVARRFLPGKIVGLSTHRPSEIDTRRDELWDESHQPSDAQHRGCDEIEPSVGQAHSAIAAGPPSPAP